MYYLLGEHLSHSYSKEIHDLLGNKGYDLLNIGKEELPNFILQKEFLGLNITIPYKETTIKYIDKLDDISFKTQVVNTVVNRNGILSGYNTDYYGFLSMCKKHNIDFKNKTALILGSGATSKTVHLCLINQGIEKAYIVSRNKQQGCITYDEAEQMTNIDYIINTTPNGMFPHIEDKAMLNLNKFSSLKACIDVVYNPYRTDFLIEAKLKGIKIVSGLEMLIEQAYYSHKLFFSKTTRINTELITKKILLKHVNIVFIGMPASGKTTIGREIATALNKEHIDIDCEIEKKIKMSISEFFIKNGEKEFRQIEKEIIKEVSTYQGKVISLGGGSLILEENIKNIMRNSILVFLNRDISFLKNKKDAYKTRPLLINNSFNKLYQERINTYKLCADIEITSNGSISETIEEIMHYL